MHALHVLQLSEDGITAWPVSPNPVVPHSVAFCILPYSGGSLHAQPAVSQPNGEYLYSPLAIQQLTYPGEEVPAYPATVPKCPASYNSTQ
jgi:hypothetical protein